MSGLKTETKQIDEFAFTVTQLGAFEGLTVLHAVGRAAAPAVAKLGLGSATDLAKTEVGAFADAVQALLANLSATDFVALVKKLLNGATVDGKPLMPIMEILLAGRTWVLLRLVAFALEVNFGNFMHALGGFAALGGKGAAQPSPSPTT